MSIVSHPESSAPSAGEMDPLETASAGSAPTAEDHEGYDPQSYYAQNMRQRSIKENEDSDYDGDDAAGRGGGGGKPQTLWCGFPKSACIVFITASIIALATFCAIWWFCIKNKHPETIVKTTHSVKKVLSCKLFCQWICHNAVFDLFAIIYTILLTFILYIFCCQCWYCCGLPYNHWFICYDACDGCYANCCTCCDCGNGPSDPDNQSGGVPMGDPGNTKQGEKSDDDDK